MTYFLTTPKLNACPAIDQLISEQALKTREQEPAK
ncbi:MAG: hypothetical protein ACI9UA_005987 [Pseudoalteromonas tetraodonis]|jgi:hypothetical protein